MNILDKFKVNDDIEVDSKDVVEGATKSFIQDADVYPVSIEMAYIHQSPAGSYAVNFIFKGQGFNHRETIYMTKSTANGGENWYEDKQTGKRRLLPGMKQVNDILQCVNGKNLNEQTVEKKVIKVWDFTARKETPQEKDVITSILGEKVNIALTYNVENKKVKKGNTWVSTSERRTFNKISKCFNTDDLTPIEVRAGETEPNTMNRWKETNLGRIIDNFDPSIAQTPKTVPQNAKETPSLF